MKPLISMMLPQILSDAPIKTKIISLVVITLALPFTVCISLVSANYRTVESFADDVDSYSSLNRLKMINERLPDSLSHFLNTGTLDNLNTYNLNVDDFISAFDAAEARSHDLETRFLLHSIRNSFVSQYEEAHQAIRVRLTDDGDPYAWYYRAERIGRYLDSYISSLLDRTYILGTESYRRRLRSAVVARTMAVTILFLVGIFCVTLGIVFSDFITGPLRDLAVTASRMAQGDLTVIPVLVRSSDEVGVLTGSFNTMNAHIAALVDDLHTKAEIEKKLHNKELMIERNKKLIRESEFLALQARINPHFLFNTLNSISRDVILHGGRDAIALINALSSLLRYGLDQGTGISTLGVELEIVEKYALIQKYRFQDRISVETECEAPELRNVRIPAFSIQPLVENAYIHGLEPKVDGGSIRITARRKGSAVAVTVADNGISMSQERLYAVNHGKELSGDGHVSSIGLSNVRERLRLFTGDQHCFSIRSSEGSGTVVELIVRETTE